MTLTERPGRHRYRGDLGLGHTLASVNKILEVYLARTRALAEGAIIKLNAHRRNAK